MNIPTYLSDKNRHRLLIFALDRHFDSSHQWTIVEGRPFDAREQIAQDAREKREVVGQELGHVNVLQCAQKQSLLVFRGSRSLEVACGYDHLHGQPREIGNVEFEFSDRYVR